MLHTTKLEKKEKDTKLYPSPNLEWCVTRVAFGYSTTEENTRQCQTKLSSRLSREEHNRHGNSLVRSITQGRLKRLFALPGVQGGWSVGFGRLRKIRDVELERRGIILDELDRVLKTGRGLRLGRTKPRDGDGCCVVGQRVIGDVDAAELCERDGRGHVYRCFSSLEGRSDRDLPTKVVESR